MPVYKIQACLNMPMSPRLGRATDLPLWSPLMRSLFFSPCICCQAQYSPSLHCLAYHAAFGPRPTHGAHRQRSPTQLTPFTCSVPHASAPSSCYLSATSAPQTPLQNWTLQVSTISGGGSTSCESMPGTPKTHEGGHEVEAVLNRLCRAAHAGLCVSSGSTEHEARAGLPPQAHGIVAPQHLRLRQVLHQVGGCALEPALQPLLGLPPFLSSQDPRQRSAARAIWSVPSHVFVDLRLPLIAWSSLCLSLALLQGCDVLQAGPAWQHITTLDDLCAVRHAWLCTGGYRCLPLQMLTGHSGRGCGSARWRRPGRSWLCWTAGPGGGAR